MKKSRLRFTGHIAGAGTADGTRLVLGAWGESPHGAFADVMVEHPDGRRELLAPDEWVAEFVSSTYVFDEVRQVSVTVTVSEASGGAGSTWTVEAGPLRWQFTVGKRSALGHLLRLIPKPLGRTLLVARVSDVVARFVMPGVRTLGTAGNDRLEWYSAADLHQIVSCTATWDGLDLGKIADLNPPPRFGFSSTPATPSITSLTSTVVVKG